MNIPRRNASPKMERDADAGVVGCATKFRKLCTESRPDFPAIRDAVKGRQDAWCVKLRFVIAVTRCHSGGRLAVQEVYHGVLVASDFLSEVERDVLRWGGNAKTATPDRSISMACWKQHTRLDSTHRTCKC